MFFLEEKSGIDYFDVRVRSYSYTSMYCSADDTFKFWMVI